MDKDIKFLLGLGVLGAAFYLIWKNKKNQETSGLVVEEPKDSTPPDTTPPDTTPPDINPDTTGTVKAPQTGGVKPIRTTRGDLVSKSGVEDESLAVAQDLTSEVPTLEIVPSGAGYIQLKGFIERDKSNFY